MLYRVKKPTTNSVSINLPNFNRKDAKTYAKFTKKLNYVPYPKPSTSTKTKNLWVYVFKKKPQTCHAELVSASHTN